MTQVSGGTSCLQSPWDGTRACPWALHSQALGVCGRRQEALDKHLEPGSGHCPSVLPQDLTTAARSEHTVNSHPESCGHTVKYGAEGEPGLEELKG